MRIAAMNIRNRGISVSKDTFEKCVAKYQHIRALAMLDLYQMCYQSSPSEFDREEFFTALWQEFKTYRKYMTSAITGAMIYDAKILDYVMAKADDAEFTKVISALKSYLVSNKVLEDCLDFSRRCPFKRKQTSQMLKIRLSVEGEVADKSAKGLCSEYLLELIQREKGKNLVSFDVREAKMQALAERVGVAKVDFKVYKSNNKPLFVRGITFQDELNLFTYLCNGDIKGDGDFGDALNNYIKSYYQVAFLSNGTHNPVALSRDVFVRALPSICNMVDAYRKVISSRNARDFYVTEDFVYFEVDPRSYDVANEVSVEVLPAETRLGGHLIDTTTGQDLYVYNIFDGVSGELISETEIIRKGYHIEGLPVCLHKYYIANDKFFDDTSVWYYVCDVRYSADKDTDGEYKTRTLIPKVGNKIGVFTDLGDAATGHESYIWDYMRDNLVLSVSNMPEEYKDMVADLACSLLYSSAGQEGYQYTKLYGGLSDIEFGIAMIDSANTYHEFIRKLSLQKVG